MAAINPLALDAVLGRADIWTGSRLAPAKASATGYPELDAVLPGGGWPVGALTELLVPSPQGLPAAGVGELALLLPALARHTREGGYAALIAPALALHAPAWAAAGIELSRLIVIVPPSRQDALWAAEQALKSGAVRYVVAWLPEVEADALRRLQRAAEAGGSTAFVYRPGGCAGQSSPAPLRLRVDGDVGGIAVTVLKRRGPPLAEPVTVAVARPPSFLSSPTGCSRCLRRPCHPCGSPPPSPAMRSSTG